MPGPAEQTVWTLISEPPVTLPAPASMPVEATDAAEQWRSADAPKSARGRPWQKGQSGNPAGRTPNAPALAALTREKAGGADGPVLVEKLFTLIQHSDPRVSLEAVKFAVERGWGKAVDPVVRIDATSALRDLSDADLEAALRVASKLTAG